MIYFLIYFINLIYIKLSNSELIKLINLYLKINQSINNQSEINRLRFIITTFIFNSLLKI